MADAEGEPDAEGFYPTFGRAREMVFRRDLEGLKRLHLQGIVPLEDDGYDCSRTFKGLLSIAVDNYHLKMINYLLLHGCKDPLALESALTCSQHPTHRFLMFEHLWESGVRPDAGNAESRLLYEACWLGDIDMVIHLFKLGKEYPALLSYPAHVFFYDEDPRKFRRVITADARSRSRSKMDSATNQVLRVLSGRRIFNRNFGKSFKHLFASSLVHQMPEHKCDALNFLQSWDIYHAENPNQSSILARLAKSDNLLQMWWDEDKDGAIDSGSNGNHWDSSIDYSSNKVSKREKHQQFSKFCRMFSVELPTAVSKVFREHQILSDASDVKPFDQIDRLFAIYLLATWEHERTTPQLLLPTTNSTQREAGKTSPLLLRQVGFSKMEWMLKTYHSRLLTCLNVAIPVIGPPRLVVEFLYFIPNNELED